MRLDKKALLLYAVTDRTWVGRQTLYEQAECALRGGATCIQLREKELDDAAFLAEALELKALCKSYGVPFLVNDNVPVAQKSGADGVHVGQHDMRAQEVRAYIGNGKILGVSAGNVEQAIQAEMAGADYLGVGAVFPTGTKPDADAVSCTALKSICRAVSIPVVAIGGINRQNLMELKGTGIDGVALVSAIFGAGDIEQECRALRTCSEQMVTA